MTTSAAKKKCVKLFWHTPFFLYLQKHLHAVDLEDTDIADLALGMGSIEEKENSCKPKTEAACGLCWGEAEFGNVVDVEKSISLLFAAKIWTKGGAGKDGLI